MGKYEYKKIYQIPLVKRLYIHFTDSIQKGKRLSKSIWGY